MNGLKNRKGTVKIHTDFLKDLDVELATEIFSKFYPVEIIHSYFGVSTYIGYSTEFDEVKEGCICPEYDILCTRLVDEENKEVSYEVKFRLV